VAGEALIIAMAVVEGVDAGSRRGLEVDPPDFLSPKASTRLRLAGVERLDPPVDLRARIHELEICPRNRQKWGSALLGGVRGLGEHDWQCLFRATHHRSRR